MADFEELDPQTRCFALVGQFLQAWSVMEGSLHSAIGAALSIEAPKLQILCANMRFHDKLYILSTLVDIASLFNTAEKEQIRKTLREMADSSGNRNMMAHDPFHPDESKKGVEFLTVRAKGKFDLPNVIWNARKFQSEGERIDKYRLFIDDIAGKFLTQPVQLNYADALLRFLPEYGQGYMLPMQHMMSPALQDRLSRQAQAVPDLSLDPSTGEIKPQTPPKPEE